MLSVNLICPNVSAGGIPVPVYATVMRDAYTPAFSVPLMLNVDGSNRVMGTSDPNGRVEYTQVYSEGMHTLYAWISTTIDNHTVSNKVTLQILSPAEVDKVDYISLSQTEQRDQCTAGDKLRFRVDTYREDGSHSNVSHTVYLAYNGEMIDSNTTDNGTALFDVIFNFEGEQRIYAYDSDNHTSCIWYMYVNPPAAVASRGDYL